MKLLCVTNAGAEIIDHALLPKLFWAKPLAERLRVLQGIVKGSDIDSVHYSVEVITHEVPA